MRGGRGKKADHTETRQMAGKMEEKEGRLERADYEHAETRGKNRRITEKGN